MIFGLIIFLFLLYEIIYHIACFGLTAVNPLMTLGLCLLTTGFEVLIIGALHKKGKAIAFWSFTSLATVMYGAQLIYWQVFKQPLLFDAVTNAGGDAVTNYWKEILEAMLEIWLPLMLMILALVVVGIFYHKKRPGSHKKSRKHQQRAQGIVGCVAGVLLFGSGLLLESMGIGFAGCSYWDFYDPAAVFEEYGVYAGMQRNLHEVIFGKFADDEFDDLGSGDIRGDLAEDLPDAETEPSSDEVTDVTADSEGMETGSLDESDSQSSEETEEEQEEIIGDNILPIDFQLLANNEEREEVKALHQYVGSRIPTAKNEYTGMFEGYNLIYLTAEGFAPYCIDEKLTPTLYKLTHSGFQFNNFYVPIWQTSTSDGEFVNCTGLIPDQQFSFKRSAENDMPFVLPAFWKKEGIQSYGYHNNSLSYYDRYRTHENLGYFFKAALPGKLDEEEWREHLFQLEHPNAWPQSDLEMMQATLEDYISLPRFHAYYMTVSGHMMYNFSGNGMSGKNKELVAELPYSNNAKAYVACNIELDRALEWLIAELEKAGKLDNTVICLVADHYPYGLEEPEIEELRGAPLEKKYDIFRNSLILWNAKMDPVVVEKPCSSEDVVPTLLNLFGFDYDSRLYSGQDILSDSSPLVVFSDRSFMTDRLYYDARKKKVESFDGTEPDEEYLKEKKKQVKDIFTFSAGVLNYNYYETLMEFAPAKDAPKENTPPNPVPIEVEPESVSTESSVTESPS